MESENKVLLITSNVGSLFGEGTLDIRHYWLDQILLAVSTGKPVFVALHLQESGGKNYRQHSREMPALVEALQTRLSAHGFTTSRCFLDTDYEALEEYTALSSLYFVHRAFVGQVHQYNFRLQKHLAIGESATAAAHKCVAFAELKRCGLVHKEKFPPELWPAFRWGRKGFLHTRWTIADKTFDLVNLHLFHDDSNLYFLDNPTQYSANRKNALNMVLQRLEKFNSDIVESHSNLFVFGDFNFRLRLSSLVKKLTSHTREREVLLGEGGGGALRGAAGGHSSGSSSFGDDSEDSGLTRSTTTKTPGGIGASTSSCSETDPTSDDGAELEPAAHHLMRRKNSVIEYFKPAVREHLSPMDTPSAERSTWVLRIGKKRFDFWDAERLLAEWRSYREDDWEPEQFASLHECPVDFAPTYPWSEEPQLHRQLMKTRPPAWCDRIMFNGNARTACVEGDPGREYRAFGLDACIGDHKPVLLLFALSNSVMGIGRI